MFDPRAKVSSAQLAAVIGVTERRVQQLEAETVFANVGQGRSKRFVLADAVQALLAKSEAEARTAAQSASTSRDQFEAERARKLKIDNDRQENILTYTDSAVAGLDRIVGEVRTWLSALPSQITEDVAERRRIEDVVNVSMAELAARLRDVGSALRAGRDPSDAGSAHDA